MVDQQPAQAQSQRHEPCDEMLSGDHHSGAPTGNTIVSRIIELEIVPGLIARPRQPIERAKPASRTQRQPRAARGPIALQVSAEMVEDLANLAIGGDCEACQVFVDKLAASGLEHRSLFSNLLANVARLLGLRWEEDTCTFLEVTVGLAVLHQLIRNNAAPAFSLEGSGSGSMPRILLLPAPGEQHFFGLLMLADTLTASGYDVDLELDINHSDDVAGIVNDRPCEIVSLSCSNDRCLDALSESVSKLRAARCFGQRPIIIGGPAIARAPHLVSAFGADGTAEDEPGFAALLGSLLAPHSSRAKARQLVGIAP